MGGHGACGDLKIAEINRSPEGARARIVIFLVRGHRRPAGLGEPAERLSAADSVGLLGALGAVPDPRHRRGIRHSLQSILLLAVGAVMAGRTSWVGIAGWAARAPHRLRVCGSTPSAATFARVLAAIDPAVLQAALDRWITARLAARAAPPTAADAAGEGRVPRQVLAVDGKVLRGARTEAGQVMLVAAYDQVAAVVVGQVAVDDGDEIATLPAVCDTVADLHDVLVSADALHCQRSHADYWSTVGRTTC